LTLRFFFYLLTTFFVVGSINCSAATIEGKVVKVADGDTVTVLDADNKKHKVRLTGIDAPEKRQAYGNESTESLRNLVFLKTVTVQSFGTDRYKRELGKVLLNGLDVNLEQVKRGFAWHYKHYQRDQPLYSGLAKQRSSPPRNGLIPF
jgi:endonuclease YncB( thermonuclease family)